MPRGRTIAAGTTYSREGCGTPRIAGAAAGGGNAPLVPVSPAEGFAALHTSISAGETRWFAVDVSAGYTVDVFGVDRPFVEAAIPEPVNAVVPRIVDAEGRDVGAVGRLGLDRIDLGTAVAVDLDYLQAMHVETARPIRPWSEFESEPWVPQGLGYLGYDEAS